MPKRKRTKAEIPPYYEPVSVSMLLEVFHEIPRDLCGLVREFAKHPFPFNLCTVCHRNCSRICHCFGIVTGLTKSGSIRVNRIRTDRNANLRSFTTSTIHFPIEVWGEQFIFRNTNRGDDEFAYYQNGKYLAFPCREDKVHSYCPPL
jgi:hypothetical protein